MSTAQNVLRAVDANIERSPARKRARYDSGLIDGGGGGWSRSDVVLHEVFDSGIGRLDCDDLAHATYDDDTIFSRSEPRAIDVSCVSMSPNTKVKQLAILESTLTKESLDKLSLGEWDSLLVKKPMIRPTDKTNYFESLSDEVILHILRWLPKCHLRDVASACKRFHRLAQDDSLWTRLDMSNKTISLGVLDAILAKQVVILRLSKTEVVDPPSQAESGCAVVGALQPDLQSRLVYLDLSMAYVSTATLTALLGRCTRIKKLSLENVPVDDGVLAALAANRDLEVANLAMCRGIREDGLRYLVNNCRKIRELNIAWTYLSSACVQFLCENLPSSMDRLNFSGCRKLICDKNVADLVSSCPRLRELDLSDCTVITGESVRQIVLLDDVNCVALSRCYSIPYKALLYLKKCANLAYLDMHGMIDRAELHALQEGLGAQVQLNKFIFSSVARPTVGMRRTSIWNMRVRD